MQVGVGTVNSTEFLGVPVISYLFTLLGLQNASNIFRKKCEATWNLVNHVRHSSIIFSTFRYYCQQEGLPEPEALCFPGYYCDGSAKVPNPPYANCPIGHYCVEGSYIPEPCPRGSFANSERNKNVTDCKPCSPGYYCDPNATIVQERECDSGFVCILGKLLDA